MQFRQESYYTRNFLELNQFTKQRLIFLVSSLCFIDQGHVACDHYKVLAPSLALRKHIVPSVIYDILSPSRASSQVLWFTNHTYHTVHLFALFRTASRRISIVTADTNLTMGGKTWSAEEERYFWEVVVPQSQQAVRPNERLHSWETLAIMMQEAMGEPRRREYTRTMLCR